MVDARAVRDDQGRAVVSFRFRQRLHQLILVRAHGNLRHIHVAIADGHHAQVFLLGTLAAGSKLRNGSGRGRLGGLTAGVGVHFRIQNQDIYILAAGQHMVQSAVADIIGPAVAAEDPVAAFNKELFQVKDFLQRCVRACFFR